MNSRAAPFVCLPLIFSLLACQFVTNLTSEVPIPGGHSSGGLSGAAGVCQKQPNLGFNIELASQAPTCAADCTEIGPGLGRKGAEALAAELAPTDTFCSLEVSAETQAVIDRAVELEAQGKRDEALALLASRACELGGETALGKAVAAPSLLGGGGRQAVKDIMRLGEQTGMWGGDDELFINAAQSAFRDFAQQELAEADMSETMRIAEEAARLGLDDIEQQALDQARDIAEKEYKEAAASLDPCTITKDALKVVMKKVQIAMLLGVPSANEHDNPAFANLLQTMMQAAAAVKNKEGGGKIEGCKVSGDLEITYTHYTVAGQHEPIVISTKVPFSMDLTEEPPGFHTQAKLYNDKVYTYPDLTVHNVAKFDFTIDVWYLGGSTPLQVDLGIKGGSDLTLGAIPLAGPPDIDESVQLMFPLTEGAVHEFDLEGWKDWKEWKVTLHLAPK